MPANCPRTWTPSRWICTRTWTSIAGWLRNPATRRRGRREARREADASFRCLVAGRRLCLGRDAVGDGAIRAAAGVRAPRSARAHRLVAARPAAAADAGASAGPVEQPAAGTAAALRETGREVGEHAAAAPGQDPCPTAALGRHDARAAPADARKRARVPQHVARGTRQGARRVRALPGAASGTAQGAARAVAAKRRTGAAQAARTSISRDPGLGTRDSGLGTRDSGLGTRDSGLGTRDSGLGTRGKHTNDVRDSGAVRCRERPRNDADVTPDYHLQAGPYIFPNVTSPPRVTQVLATSSSAKSGFHAPSATNSSLKLARLRAYISDACSGAPDGRFSGPITTTPLRSIR